jgi:Ca-activated chloride channel family protein
VQPRAIAVASVIAAVLWAAPWPRALASAQQLPVFHGGVDLVHLGVTVTDRKGNLVTDLRADDFEIDEDGKKQTIQYFASGLDSGPETLHTHLGLLLDVSESMGEDIGFTKTAAIKFLNSLLEAVDITMIDFDTEVRATRYSQADFVRLIERIRLQKASGNTALYDAIGVYLTGAEGQDGRKVMLLYTDGGDTRSSMSFVDLYSLLKASDATLYVIGELEHQLSLSRTEQRMRLQQMAEATGGQAFFPVSVKELDQMYEKVLAEVRAQYTIGYVPTNDTADGAWRKVDVKVRRKDCRVRSRKGYFGPYKRIPYDDRRRTR